MCSKATEDTNKIDQSGDLNPLMDVYNALPPEAEQPVRFYWQEPWHGVSGDGAVQAAFEN